MPKMDGYEATEILKSDPATQDIRIVAVSAYASPEDFARGQEAGFDTYVTKPVVTDNILAELDETLAAGSTTPVV